MANMGSLCAVWMYAQVSFEERSKMGDETLTNVNGLRRRDAPKAVSGVCRAVPALGSAVM